MWGHHWGVFIADQDEEVDETFCTQLKLASHLWTLVLMVDLNHPASCAHSGRFL